MEKGRYSYIAGSLICLRCRTPRLGGGDCPVCDSEPSADPAESAGPEPRPSPEWCELESVFEAPHEIAAISVQAVLEEEEIPAIVRSTLIPAYGGLATRTGVWGWVLVPRDWSRRARAVVGAYLASIGLAPADDGR